MEGKDREKIMAAREQLNVVEMILELINGTTGPLGKTDFIPQKTEVYPVPCRENYFPEASPESVGISSRYLEAMLRELGQNRMTDIHHLMVLRKGKKICDCNFAPYRGGIWHVTYSMCKSITGMAIGLLESEGKVSLDEDIYRIFEKRTGLFQKILRPSVTVENLLTMQSGVDFNEMGAVSGNNWVNSFLEAPVRNMPGTVFEYNSMNSYLLSAVVTERTGMSMMEYLRPRLWEPLGIREVFWESCPAGITKGGWGLFLRPEDAAKLGQMYLQNGVWEGKQILPADWIKRSVSVHSTPQEQMGSFGYGYQIWMEERPGSYAFNGMLGQNVVVYPDMEMVVVTNAGSNELFVNCELLRTIRKYFGKEFQPADRLPESPREYRNLRETQKRMEGIRRDRPEILHGGWRNHCPGRRMREEHQVSVRMLDRKWYRMDDCHVGLLPLAMQVFHNNFSAGIRRIGFSYEKGRLFLLLEEGEATHRIEIGLNRAEVSTVEVNGERYLVAGSGEFTENEDHIPVLSLDLAFLEEAMRRKLKILFRGEDITVRWNETPGCALIMEGLESLMSEMTGKLVSFLKEKGGDDMIRLMMKKTIEPEVSGSREEN